MIDFVWNYNKLKFCLTSEQIRIFNNYDMLLRQLVNMFEFQNVPDSIDTKLLQIYKLLYGSYAIFNTTEYGLTVGYPTRGGGLKPNGLPKEFNIFTLSDIHKDRCADGYGCVIGWNNQTKTSELFTIFTLSKELSECEKSELALLRGSRKHTIFEVFTQNEKNQIESALKQSESGKTASIIVNQSGKNWYAPINMGDDRSIKNYDMFDYKASESLQYVSKHYNEIVKRFYFIYGLPLSNGEKLAQQTVEEVTSNVTASSNYANELLNEMKIFIGKLNNTYKLDVSVDFSESWKNAMKGVVYNDREKEET